MWGVANDQLCADPLCPISCGGKYERNLGESTEWLLATLQKKLVDLSPRERKEREIEAKQFRDGLAAAKIERPDFWKANSHSQ